MFRKKGIVIAASALVGALTIVGGTLAYFTAQDDVTNVVTMGNVSITLEEPGFSEENLENVLVNVVPGQSFTKDPTITNTGKNPAYVRIKVDPTISADVDIDDSIANIDTTNWTYSGGYYYYNNVLAPGEAVVFFDTLTVPSTIGNEYEDVNFEFKFVAEAVQSQYFTPTKNDGGKIVGWPSVTF